MLAARTLERESGADEAVEHLQLPRVLDRVASVAMRLERALIEAGLSFPAGGSLLIVATRPA
jgi:hypothetical protein